MAEKIETVIIGGGQAGLSVSYFLTKAGREHLVLEKASQPGDAWRNQRWDSFTFVTPNWSFLLPGGEYQGADPHGFMPRAEIVQRFADYVQQYHLPVVYNTRVTQVIPEEGGYCITTEGNVYHARNVVIANGFFQEGKVPDFAAQIPTTVTQLHSRSYRNPQALPEGAVLVVGTGQSGMQIAEEIYQSGRKLFLATSGAPRAPRRYRGKDIFEWLYASGFFEQTFQDFLATGQTKFVPPQVTGKDGGHGLNLHKFYLEGVTLLGHARGYHDGKIITAADLPENLGKSDGAEKMFTKRIDDYIERANLEAPEEQLPVWMDAYQAPNPTELDLQANGIRTILWACGYQYNLSFLQLPILNQFGFPETQQGISSYPGLYILGIPFQPRLKSGFLFGIAENSEYIAEHITKRGI